MIGVPYGPIPGGSLRLDSDPGVGTGVGSATGGGDLGCPAVGGRVAEAGYGANVPQVSSMVNWERVRGVPECALSEYSWHFARKLAHC
jgi:hypothetical protein